MKKFCDRYNSHAWVLFGASLLFNFISGLENSSLSVLYVELIAYFQTSSATVGWLVSLRHGSFHFCRRMSLRVAAMLGATLQAMSVLVASFSVDIAMTLIFQGLLAGVGSIISTVPIDVAIPLVFHADRAITSGLSLLAVLLGMVFGPTITEIFLDLYGLHGATLLLGGLLLNRIPLAMTILCPEESQPTRKATLRTTLLKEPTFLLFCAAASFQKLFSDPFVAHLPNYAVTQGVTLAQATVLPTALYISCTLTGLLASVVSNFVPSKHRVLIFSLAGLIAMMAALFLLILPSYTGDIVASIIGGVDVGLYTPLVIVVLVDLVGKDRLMLAFPLFNTSIGFVVLFATPLCGWLLDITGSYTASYLTLGSSAVLSATLFFVIWLLGRDDVTELELNMLLPMD